MVAYSQALRSGSATNSGGSAQSDADGLLRLTVPEGEAFGIHLLLPDGTWLPSISDRDIAAAASPYRVLVGAAASLQVVASSQGQPVPGVFALLYSRDGAFLIRETRGNDQGLVEFTVLGAGAYRVELHTGQHLPIRADQTAQPTDHWLATDPIELNLHPYTNAALHFVDPTGQPVQSAPVQLEHLPSGLAIQSAIDRGWLADCPTLTDDQGRLIAPRLPLGAYRFQLATSPPLQGSFTLTGPEPLTINAAP